jgi:2-methylisocitrate lyase-like PEP mutase family enzyme
MTTQREKGQAFRTLHHRKNAFIIPNPWDIGSARMLAHLGFEALATTSGGFAFSMGKRDYTVGREMVIAHISGLAAATDLPISADLENGFGDAPEAAAETIRLAAAAGAVGGSIEDATGEDATGRGGDPIYEQVLAAERIRAAAEISRGLDFNFTLTARAENYLHGRGDLKDTIQRLQAYQEAGADVLYAPGLTSKEDIAAVVNAVDRPVNVLVGIPGVPMNLAELSAIGVRRISLGSGLARAAFGSVVRATQEMRERGTFAFAEEAPSSRDIGAML